MASEDNLLNRLIHLVRSFDDAAWEALASKGLLRRARKDMEKGLAIEIVGEGTHGLDLKVPPFVVVIPPSGPARATCTCPAPGICQHVLCAGLFLQNYADFPSEQKPRATADSIRAEINSISADRLKAWAGAADFRAGVAIFEKNSLPSVIEYGENVLIRLMPSSIEARFVPGGGIDGMILPSLKGKSVAVAALLALRKSLGFEIPQTAVQQSLIELSGTPRTKEEILESAQSVLEDAVTVGLSHLSPVVADRLLTLAVSAQGANLPRVSLALRAISDEVRSILQREARADESRLLTSTARVYALMEAIAHSEGPAASVLIGTCRLQYVDVPEIDLFGVGAYAWKTGSGYSGLTVLFWSNQSREFLSWSEARPSNQQFDSRQRFHGEGPWDGSQSPRQVASSNLKLRNARRTISGRLSGSTKTSALVLASTAPQALEFGERLFTSWNDLHRYLRQRQPLGLRDSNPLDMIAVLEPSWFDARAFDSITQAFSWNVGDQAGAILKLTLPFRDWNKEAIRVLEGLAPPKELRWRILVRLASRDDGLAVEPISILRAENQKTPIFQLSFDALPQTAGMKQTAASARDEDDAAPDEESSELEEELAPRAGFLRGLVSEFNRRLDAIAEAGCQSGFELHRKWFDQAHGELLSSGLTGLARAIDVLRKPSAETSRAVLQARFLSHLHTQASGHVL